MSEMNEKFRFSTETEISIHKQISKMKYGERLEIKTVIKKENDKKEVLKAIKKSADYNCMRLGVRWLKDFDSVLVSHEM